MKILTVVGARPQFIKAATISRVVSKTDGVEEIIVHTGQHYDKNMSDIFFEDLDIPKPHINLEVGSGLHGKQTGLMIDKIEEVLIAEKPDVVLLYGDTNSTLAGAVAASKLHIKIAHVEAGLRSFNKQMPEEINRIMTDHVSDYLFAPTKNAVELLEKEGLQGQTYLSGDVMYDAVLNNQKLANSNGKVSYSNYYLATIHRQENTDDLGRLQSIFKAFAQLDKKVVIPIHPRTKQFLDKIEVSDNVELINPVGPLDMLSLISNCEKVLTDSGGLQKEAYFLKKQCVTLRDETEWVETLNNGWNCVVGANTDEIVNALNTTPSGNQKQYFGDGKAAEKIIDTLKKDFSQ